MAKKLGYYVDGWNLADYIRDAIEKYGWEEIVIWGPKGSGKSNTELQIGYLVYKNWDIVLDMTIYKPELYTKKTEKRKRIPCLKWDDITVHLPRSLYFTNRKLYQEVKKNWTAQRVTINVFVCTTPHKEELPDFILRDMSLEIILGKQIDGYSLYMVQRHVYLPDFKRPLKELRRMVLVEEDFVPFTPEKAKDPQFLQLRKLGSTEWPGVPKEVFKQYWDMRIEMAMEAREKLNELFQQISSELPDEDWISVSEAARIWKVTPQTIRNAIKDNIIKKWRRLPSGRLQVSKKEILDMIQKPLDALPEQVK